MGSLVARGDLGLPVQALALDQLLPFGKVKLTPELLVWSGTVRPQPECDTYTLRLDYRFRSIPTVAVSAPDLRSNQEGLLPHVYSTGHLCVSQFGDWHPRMLLTDTFVPWVCEWLVYYELWLATGIWQGDGPDGLDDVSQARILHPYN